MKYRVDCTDPLRLLGPDDSRRRPGHRPPDGAGRGRPEMAGAAAVGRPAGRVRRPRAVRARAALCRKTSSRWTPPSSTCPTGCWTRIGRCWSGSSRRATAWRPGRRSGGGAGDRRVVHGRPGAVRGLLPSVSQRVVAAAREAAGRGSTSRATTSTTTASRAAGLARRRATTGAIVVISKSGGTLETAVGLPHLP